MTPRVYWHTILRASIRCGSRRSGQYRTVGFQRGGSYDQVLLNAGFGVSAGLRMQGVWPGERYISTVATDKSTGMSGSLSNGFIKRIWDSLPAQDHSTASKCTRLFVLPRRALGDHPPAVVKIDEHP